MADDNLYETIHTYRKHCSDLDKDGYVVFFGRPCKVTELNAWKNDKLHVVATDIFTGRKYEEIFPSGQVVEVPKVERAGYRLLGVEDGFLSLQGDDGSARDDVRLPEGEFGESIEKALEEGPDNTYIVVLSAMGEDCAIEINKR